MALGAPGEVGLSRRFSISPSMPVSRAPSHSVLSSSTELKPMSVERSVRPGAFALCQVEPGAAQGEGERAEVLAALEQNIVEADMGRMRLEQRRSRLCG